MTMNPLPPQAYTKETLLKAYQWLTGQNASIKEMATTPDILVSLFLKATRDGDHALERPSIQNFKNELKSLAGMMTELDRKTPPAKTAPQAMKKTEPVPPLPGPVTFPTFAAENLQIQDSPAAAAKTAVTASLPPTSSELNVLESLDELTLNMIREVKADFNLSHESEALRMLVKVGYVRAKSFLR